MHYIISTLSREHNEWLAAQSTNCICPGRLTEWFNRLKNTKLSHERNNWRCKTGVEQWWRRAGKYNYLISHQSTSLFINYPYMYLFNKYPFNTLSFNNYEFWISIRAFPKLPFPRTFIRWKSFCSKFFNSCRFEIKFVQFLTNLWFFVDLIPRKKQKTNLFLNNCVVLITSSQVNLLKLISVYVGYRGKILTTAVEVSRTHLIWNRLASGWGSGHQVGVRKSIWPSKLASKISWNIDNCLMVT